MTSDPSNDVAYCVSCGEPLLAARYGPIYHECSACRAGVTPDNAAAAPQEEGAGR